MAIAKAAVAIVGVVGVATATSLALVSSSPVSMPEWKPLSSDANGTNGYTSKYTEKYLKYLVGEGTAVTGSTDKKTNDAWWEWAFNNRYKPVEDKAADEFAKGKITTWNKLRDACKDAYGAEANAENVNNVSKLKVTVTGTTTTYKYYKEDDFWTFCSSGSTKIKTISEGGESAKADYTASSSYGADTSKQSTLAATKGYDNKWFWELREKELFGDNQLFAGVTESETNEFKKLWNKNKGKYEVGKLLIKAKCEEAYKETDTNNKSSKYPESELTKFCSIKGS